MELLIWCYISVLKSLRCILKKLRTFNEGNFFLICSSKVIDISLSEYLIEIIFKLHLDRLYKSMTYLVYIFHLLLIFYFLLCVGFQCLFRSFILFFRKNWKKEYPGGRTHVMEHVVFHCRKTFLVDEKFGYYKWFNGHMWCTYKHS